MDNIEFDNKKYTIFGVQFNSVESFNSAKSAIASSFYEGFRPSSYSIRKIRDVVEGNISREQLIKSIKIDSKIWINTHIST